MYGEPFTVVDIDYVRADTADDEDDHDSEDNDHDDHEH